MAEVNRLTNTDLNQYFENEVKISRQETSHAKDVVLSKVHQLLKFINNEDPRFGLRPVRVGSSFQGLKTSAPDEFDFNILLVDLGDFVSVPSRKRYYGFSESVDKYSLKTTPTDVDIVSMRVPLPESPEGFVFISYDDKDCKPMWKNSENLIFKGDIIPYLVRKSLKDLLKRAIRSLGLRGELRLGRKVHGPALTLRIPYNQDDIEEITVDFAPTIPNVGKLHEDTKWPPGPIQWPSVDKISEIEMSSVNAIAKEPFYWLLSFAKGEEMLMKDIDSDGGCRKAAHRIMKQLRQDFWCKTSKPVISSYMLKNILFLECEQYPQTHQWEQIMLATRVHSMILFLLRCIKKGRLPQYFNRAVNLLSVDSQNDKKTLQLEQRNIDEFIGDPSRFFHEE